MALNLRRDRRPRLSVLRFFASLRMTVTDSAKNSVILRGAVAESKDLMNFQDSSPAAQNDNDYNDISRSQTIRLLSF